MEVLDRCVVTSAATATWRNVDVVDVELLTSMHHNQIAPDEDRLTVGRAALLSTKGIVFLISIGRPPCLFLWWSSRTDAHPGDFSGIDLLVKKVSWIAAMLSLFLLRKVNSSERINVFASIASVFATRFVAFMFIISNCIPD